MKITSLAGLFVVLVCVVHAEAATMLGPTGVTEPFNTRPTVASGWATASIAGGANQPPVTNPNSAASLTAAVQLLSATSVTTQVGDNGTTTTGHQLAQWMSGPQNLRMQPTGNAYTVLMNTLQNNTGFDANKLQLSYDFGVNSTTPSEEVLGWLAFYSLTGNPGDWIAIPEFSDGAAGLKSVELDLNNWAQGSLLYLLWADDNGSIAVNANPAATEGNYSLDNFSAFALAVPEPSSVAVWGLAAVALSVAGIRLQRRKIAAGR